MAPEMNPAAEESVRRVEGLMKDVLAITPDGIDEDLIESGLLDSMALVELLRAIERDSRSNFLSKISMSTPEISQGDRFYVSKLRTH